MPGNFPDACLQGKRSTGMQTNKLCCAISKIGSWTHLNDKNARLRRLDLEHIRNLCEYTDTKLEKR